MQVSGASVGATIGETLAEGGIRPFYKGLMFAYGRELSYTSIKLGACKFNRNKKVMRKSD